MKHAWICLLIAAASSGQPLKIGEPAPPLTLERTLPAGVETAWTRLRGQPVVLEFWATWCEPCVEQIPHVDGLASKYPGVRFIWISDEAASAVEPFLARRPIQGTVALDRDGATFQAYGVGSRPRTVFIDAAGVVRGSMHPRQVTEVVLEDLLAGRNVSPQGPPEPLHIFEDPGAGPVYATALRRSGNPGRGGVFGVDPGLLQGVNIDLRVMIGYAWSVDTSRLVGPEDALRTRWDFCVSLPAGMSGELAILRELLERSLGLKVRAETRQVEAMVLRPGRAKLAESRDGKTMKGLASMLAYQLKLPVVDETGLTGRYAFEYPPDYAALEAFVREQLGLDVTRERRPIEFLFVDSLQLPEYREYLPAR